MERVDMEINNTHKYMITVLKYNNYYTINDLNLSGKVCGVNIK